MGRMSLCWPEYSPTNDGSMSVLSMISFIHWRADEIDVQMIRVCSCAVATAPNPMTVLPAPQGRTRTPLPPASLPSDHHAASAPP